MSTEKNLLVDLWLVSVLATRLVDGGLEDSPLSVDEFAVYGLIADFGPVTATQLSRWTGIPTTTMSAIVRRCQARSELTRSGHPSDRRSSLLALTPLGETVYQQSLPALFGALSRLAAVLAAPEQQVREVLASLDDALRMATGADPRPYQLASRGDAAGSHSLSYEGTGLSHRQRTEVATFIDFVRHRDA